MVEIALSVGLAACAGTLVWALVKISKLKKEQANQAKAIKALREKCAQMKFQRRVSAADTNLAIFLLEERVAELTRTVDHQKRLLNQKWTEAKQNVHVG